MQTITDTYDIRIAAVHKLRVNIKSLATEAKIIRQETARCGRRYKAGLAEHRRGRLREEARYANLALAMVRGRPYRTVEQKCGVLPDLKRLAEKVRRAYWNFEEKHVKAWLEAK